MCSDGRIEAAALRRDLPAMDATPEFPALADRIAGLPWPDLARELDAHGAAMVPGLLSRQDCEAVAGWYDADPLFRSRVVMSRHGFGRGEYRYFAYPLPELVADLRAGFYPPLAEIAARLGAPGASRGVAQACRANPLAVAIPCHRVVRSDGALSGYRWGVERKRTLLAREASA